MRPALPAIVLAALLVAGCATTQTSYQTTTTVTPAGPKKYTIGWTIQATEADGSQSILSAPKVTVLAGEEARVEISGDIKEDGVFCTALVKETVSGLETLTTVTVKKAGKTTFNTTQKTLFKK